MDWEEFEPKQHFDRWQVLPSCESILLVNENFRKTPREKAYRAFKAKPKPWWHEEQLAKAQESNNIYSATFHAAWLLILNPQSQDAYDAFHANYDNLAPDFAKLTPTVVVEALDIPRPQ